MAEVVDHLNRWEGRRVDLKRVWCLYRQNSLTGLAGEPDVRPMSVAAWAGSRVFRERGRIDAVAHALGMRSLDRAAALIGWDWQAHPVGGEG